MLSNDTGLLYRQFWADFVLAGEDAYHELFDDAYVQTFLCYSCVSYLLGSRNLKFKARDEDAYLQKQMKKSPHRIPHMVGSENMIKYHIEELLHRGFFAIFSLGKRDARGLGPCRSVVNTARADYKFFVSNFICRFESLKAAAKNHEPHYVQNPSPAYKKYVKEMKAFLDFDEFLNFEEQAKNAWRQPHLVCSPILFYRAPGTGSPRIEIPEDLQKLARAAKLPKQYKECLRFELRYGHMFTTLGFSSWTFLDVLVDALRNRDHLSALTGYPFDKEDFSTIITEMNELIFEGKLSGAPIML